MKTKECTTGKIWRKTSLIILAIMISAGMFAQKSLNSFELNQYASELFLSTGEITSAINSVKEKKAFYEEEILLEEWMINLEYWAEKMDTFNVYREEEVIIEEKLELESWMTDLKAWKCGESDRLIEEEMELEPWMVDLESFMENNPVKAQER